MKHIILIASDLTYEELRAKIVKNTAKIRILLQNNVENVIICAENCKNCKEKKLHHAHYNITRGKKQQEHFAK